MSDDRTPDDDITADAYADLAALAKTLTGDDERLEDPPADLWARIESRISVSDVAPPAPTDLAAVRASRRPAMLVGIAAAVVAIATVAGLAVAASRDRGSTTVADVALVNTDLDPRGAGSSGEARLVKERDGTYALDITVDGLPDEDDGFFELWVIDSAVEGMVSLGPLQGSGHFPLPASVDPGAFPIVDISIEPADGVPTHSGASVLRGVLDA